MPGIATGAWESRVMMPTMKAASSALVALVLFAGCGGDPEPRPGASATASQEDLASLQDRVAELEDLVDDLREGDDRMAARLRATTTRLGDSVSSLRSSLQSAEDDATDALADAGAAAARVEQVARDLSVLTERYDYHLRRYHGRSE
jgi:TolA-binding protein